MEKIRIGYALCGSFCTMKEAISAMALLKNENTEVFPIMSEIAYNTDTRFGKSADIRKQITDICGREIIHDIPSAEPIGPKKLLDIIVVAPCTGNTAAKIALGITDTPVTMAVKAHLRNKRPVVIGIATNDALSASAKNIGMLLNTKNIFFVPYGQDDAIKKETSLVCDFTKIPETVTAALGGNQVQPVFLQP